MIYLDTSAMVKLIVHEAETPALIEWLGQRVDDPAVTSALGRVELMRTATRDGSDGIIDRARNLLGNLDILPLSDVIIATAETIGAPTLRSLDAIHLAAATQIRNELTAIVAYDQRLIDACTALGYPTSSPTD